MGVGKKDAERRYRIDYTEAKRGGKARFRWADAYVQSRYCIMGCEAVPRFQAVMKAVRLDTYRPITVPYMR